MANHKSAIKRNRQNIKRNIRNTALKSRMRTAVKKFLIALQEKEENVKDLLLGAISTIDRTASKGVIPKTRASRLISRLSKKVHQPTS